MSARVERLAAIGRAMAILDGVRFASQEDQSKAIDAVADLIEGRTPSGAAPPLARCQWGLSCNERGCPMPCALDSKVTWHPKDGCLCAYHLKREPDEAPLTCETCGERRYLDEPTNFEGQPGGMQRIPCPDCKERP